MNADSPIQFFLSGWGLNKKCLEVVTMKKVELKEVKAYEAPGHFGMTAMKLHGTEESGAKKFWRILMQ